MNNQNFLNDNLLATRIEKFYGYGNYKGKYWFIGMEEAGEADFHPIEKRVDIWAKRGENEIEDVAEYHKDIGYPEIFEEGAKLQRTWKGLIRILLSIKKPEKENFDIECIRKYQIHELARRDKETCLLELLPLPSPSIYHWIYGKYSKLDFLRDRETYENNNYIEKRINHISQRIREYQPNVVVFYGLKYNKYWRKIIDIEFTKIDFSEKEYFFIGKTSGTVFVISQHSVARGATNECFHYIGKLIAAKLAEK